MKKRLKRLIPTMALALTCIASAGLLTACDEDKNSTSNSTSNSPSNSGSNSGANSTSAHQHSYTERNHDENEHWWECPEDGTIDETTREGHKYVAGECECGALEPVAPKKYGKLTGKVKLHKKGTFETDFSGVHIDLSDDGAELTFDEETGEFTFDNVEAEKNHILTITKDGYKEYTLSSVQVEEDQTATIGGEDGIVLEYDVFGILENYDPEYHDLSHVNDEDPYILFKEHPDNRTLNVITKDSYTNVSASMRINWNNSTNNMHTQGIILKFADGNHAIIRYHNGDMENGNIQYANALWSSAKENSIFADSELNQWGEGPFHTLLSSETNEIKNGEGLDLKVVVDNDKIYTYFADNWIGTHAIPEETVGKTVQVAFFAFDAKSNAIFHYDISETIPSSAAAVNVTVNKPEDAEAASANVTADKESYTLGEQVTLSVTKPLGYKIETLLVNDVDKASEINNNQLTFTANKAEMNVVATFVKEAPMAINIAMKGRKMGTTAKLAENTDVTFKNTEYTFKVNAEGNIENPSVVKGKYTVVVAGYLEKDIVLDENLNEIVLEYDTFGSLENWDTDLHDYSHANEENPYIFFKENGGGKSLNAITKDSYTNVSASMLIKYNNSDFYMHTQGIELKFENGKHAIIRYHNGDMENGNIQYANDMWSAKANNSIFAASDLNQWGEGAIHTLLSSETNTIKNDGLELKVVVNNDKIYTYFAGNWIGTYDIPTDTVGKKVQVAFFAFNAASNAKFHYDISETIPSAASAVNVTVNKPEDAEAATANVTADKESYTLGEDVTLSITVPTGYEIKTLLVNDVDMASKINNNQLVFTADSSEINVVATFEAVAEPTPTPTPTPTPVE